jgi:hypothetical protein
LPLTDLEKAKVKKHLGYPVVNTAAGMSFGIPIPLQTLFIVDSAVTFILEAVVPDVRNILNVMDGIEQKMVDGQDFLPASKVDDISVRPDHIERLEDEFARWGWRLANLIGAFPYPLSPRYKGRSTGGVVAGMIPSRRG